VGGISRAEMCGGTAYGDGGGDGDGDGNYLAEARRRGERRNGRRDGNDGNGDDRGFFGITATTGEEFGMDENGIGDVVVDAAVTVHRELGPGLFESVYEVVLAYELKKRGLHVERQVAVPIVYRGLHFDEGFRADIIVESKVILELKTVSKMTDMHKKQLLTYLKLTNMKLGYLLNFAGTLMKDGISRTVNGL